MEGFESRTQAAAARWLTIVDMPLNCISRYDDRLRLWREKRCRERSSCCRLCRRSVVPGNENEIRALVAGVRASNLSYSSGTDEFEMVGERELCAAMPVISGQGCRCWFTQVSRIQ